MCNAYEMGGKRGGYPGSLRAEAIRRLEEFVERRLIRRTDVAPVITSMGVLEEMSWGFRREKLGVINNSRSDKLAGPMWSEPYQQRRCLIPVSCYYEWKGPKGRKETYCFESLTGEPLWMAGIWEDSSRHGRCFSMITTEASREVLPIHHRMPAALRGEQLEPFLEGEEFAFGVDFEPVTFRESENPLVQKPQDSDQGELF